MSLRNYLEKKDNEAFEKVAAAVEEKWADAPALLDATAENYQEIQDAIADGQADKMTKAEALELAAELVQNEVNEAAEGVEKQAAAFAEDIAAVMADRGFDAEVIEKIASEGTEEDHQELEGYINDVADEILEFYNSPEGQKALEDAQ